MTSCNNITPIMPMSYVGDDYAALIANFRCLDARVCNLNTKAISYRETATIVTSKQAQWNAAWSYVNESSGAWAEMTSIVHHLSAHWSGPITVVYNLSIPASVSIVTTVTDWLESFFPATDYRVGITIMVFVPRLNQDPSIHTVDYEWEGTSPNVPLTYVESIPCFSFICTKSPTGLNRWTYSSNTIGNNNQSTHVNNCSIFGNYNVPSPCRPNGVLDGEGSFIPNLISYYSFTNILNSRDYCYCIATGGQYDQYIGKVVRKRFSSSDWLLGKFTPLVSPPNSALCLDCEITEVYKDPTGEVPDQCYTITPITSSGLGYAVSETASAYRAGGMASLTLTLTETTNVTFDFAVDYNKLPFTPQIAINIRAVLVINGVPTLTPYAQELYNTDFGYASFEVSMPAGIHTVAIQTLSGSQYIDSIDYSRIVANYTYRACEQAIITCTDLSKYVGKTIRLCGEPERCWYVQKSTTKIGAQDVCVSDEWCFELRDCKGCAPSVWAKNDLYEYVGKVVIIEGSPHRYQVIDTNCPNASEACNGEVTHREVAVSKVFDTCDSPEDTIPIVIVPPTPETVFGDEPEPPPTIISVVGVADPEEIELP